MHNLVTVASQAKNRKRYDDDAVDRLHNTYTVVVLVIFAVIITGQLYYGSPITCWVPAHFTGGWIKYTNNLCWVNNTYYLRLDDDTYVPKAHEIKGHQYIEYYQWMPFILLTQAFFFYVPSLFWQAFNSKSGIDSDNILESAFKLSHCQDQEKYQKLRILIRNQIDGFVSNPRIEHKRSIWHKFYNALCCVCGLWTGSYLIMLYIAAKLLYVFNVIAQMVALNYILKTDFISYFGLRGFLSDDEQRLDEERFLSDRVFPKVTMCDIYVRVLGNSQRYTVQCVLPVNMFTEKMYLFIWWWFMFVLLVTAFNLCLWIIRTLFGLDRFTYIRNHMEHLKFRGKLQDYDRKRDKVFVEHFTYSYLRHDGVFLFRMIGHNTNQLTLDDIIVSVWDLWLEKMERRDKYRAPKTDHHLFATDDAILTYNGGKPSYLRERSVPSAPVFNDGVDSVTDGDSNNLS